MTKVGYEDRMKRLSSDWKLAAGFGALLFLIVAIGAVGISQIQSLSKTVDDFGKYYFPMQKAALEMRINNSLFARGVRNYVYWHSARYLEAAREGADKQVINSAQAAFDQQLADYESFAQTESEKKWVGAIVKLQKELRDIGDNIINLTDRLDTLKDSAKRNRLEQSINSLVMTFEDKLYRIDDFIEMNLQKANLESVEEQLLMAESAKRHAVSILFWSLLAGLLVGGETAYLIYRNRKTERENRKQLVHRMIRLEEEERQNLSFQVHNQMGQDLSALKIYIDLIDKNVREKTTEAAKNISQVKDILSGLVGKSHNIAELLRPPALEGVGLIETIEDLIFQYKQMAPINFSYKKPESPLELSDEYSLILYRAVQEGLTNIVKYANAKRVKIMLEKKPDAVFLTIADDGVGFNYGTFTKPFRRREEDKLKLGLAGLRERVTLLDGELNIDTAPGKGTTLRLVLPLQGVRS